MGNPREAEDQQAKLHREVSEDVNRHPRELEEGHDGHCGCDRPLTEQQQRRVNDSRFERD